MRISTHSSSINAPEIYFLSANDKSELLIYNLLDRKKTNAYNFLISNMKYQFVWHFEQTTRPKKFRNKILNFISKKAVMSTYLASIDNLSIPLCM